MCVVALAMGAMGCEKTSAFCNEHPEDVDCGGSNMPPDGNNGEGCTETCAGDTPVCDKDHDKCVGCLTSADCAIATAPVCGDVGSASGKSCHACEGPDDCDSKACLPTGQCAAAADVTYARSDGNNNNACDLAAPCATIKGAIAKSPTKTVVILGGLNEQATIMGGDVVTILGGTNDANIAFNNQPIFTVNGASLTVADVQLHLTTDYCVQMTINGGTLALERVDLNGCGLGGVHASAGSVTIKRSTIHDNPGSGILFDGSVTGFVVTNTYVLNNGGSNFNGGVTLGTGSGTFAFNTVVGNATNAASTQGAGIDCSGATLTNNIVVGNLRKTTTVVADIVARSTCTMTGTNIADIPATDLNLDMSVAAAKLTAQSTMAIDKVTTTLDTDNKGIIRPQGAMADVGADELRKNP